MRHHQLGSLIGEFGTQRLDYTTNLNNRCGCDYQQSTLEENKKRTRIHYGNHHARSRICPGKVQEPDNPPRDDNVEIEVEDAPWVRRSLAMTQPYLFVRGF